MPMKLHNFILIACMMAYVFDTRAQPVDEVKEVADKAGDQPRLFEKLYLGQNVPNPVNVHQSIIIPFRSIGNGDAKIIVFNDEGEPVITFEDLDGKENVTIEGDRLPPGNYRYYLIVSGRVVKRKKVQVTE